MVTVCMFCEFRAYLILSDLKQSFSRNATAEVIAHAWHAFVVISIINDKCSISKDNDSGEVFSALEGDCTECREFFMLENNFQPKFCEWPKQCPNTCGTF